MLTLIAELAEEQPLLCLVDDMQWLDRASLDALLFAARRLAAERITMIFAGRDESEPAVHGLLELRLSALTRADCERLLAERGADLSPEARDRVIEEADGNPLALLHFAANLTAEQQAGHRPGLSAAKRLEQSLRTAIQRLPDRTQLMLLVAAAEGSGNPQLVLKAAQVLGAGPEDLAPAEHASLVEVSDDRLRFHHPLIKAAAYHEAPLARPPRTGRPPRRRRPRRPQGLAPVSRRPRTRRKALGRPGSHRQARPGTTTRRKVCGPSTGSSRAWRNTIDGSPR